MAIVKQITLKADTSSAVKDVKKLNKEVSDTGKKGKAAGQGLKGAFTGFSNAVAGAIPMLARLKVAMISTGVGALVVAFGSLVALFKSAADLGADFGKALSSLSAVSGKTKKELESLTIQAKQLGESTAFTAVEVVGLQTELAKLGFTVQEIENSTPAILGLAASLEVDLSSAAMLAGSTVRAFGLDTLETQRVVDVLALSTSKSALDFDGLTESLKLVAPTSRATGVSIEETTALLGVLADSGLKGSIAGTKLSKTFIMLNKKGLTLEQGLDQVNNSSNKLNTAIGLVGLVGAGALLNLAGAGDKIGTLTTTLEDSAEAAKKMAEIRLDNLAGDMTKLGSAWDGFLLGIEDGEGIISKLQRGSIQFLTGSVKFLGDAIDFTSFLFKDFFESLEIGFSMTKNIVGGGFGVFTGIIKKFSNQAILLISEIPIIGKAIDAEKIEFNLRVAEAEIERSQLRIQEGLIESNKLTIRTNTYFQRYGKSLEQKEKREGQTAIRKLEETMLLEDVEAKKAEEAARLKAAEKAEAERLKLLAKFQKKEADLRATDAFKKLELDKERNIAAIEALGLELLQENELKLAYEETYLIQKQQLEQKVRDEAAAAEEANNLLLAGIKTKKDKEDLDDAKALALSQEQIRAMNLRRAQGALSALGSSLEEGTAGQKTAAIASLALNTGVGFSQGLVIAQQGALGTGPLAPFSYPIFAATQIAAVIGMAAKAKSILSKVKGGGSISTPSPPSVNSPRRVTESAQPQTPSFNVVGTSGASQIADIMGSQPPIQAFVVSSDVTTAQSLERNIIDSATL